MPLVKNAHFTTIICQGRDSSCGYQRDNATEYNHSFGLPLWVIMEVKPIFQRLNQDDLRSAFAAKHIIKMSRWIGWFGRLNFCVPKEVFVARETSEFGMYEVNSNFSIGTKTTLYLTLLVKGIHSKVVTRSTRPVCSLLSTGKRTFLSKREKY